MKNLTLRATRLFPVLLAAGVLATATPTFAQPTGGPGMNDNPPNADAGGRGGGRGGNRGQNGQNGQNGNRGDRTQMQTQMLTRSLQSAGFTDEGTIEAVTTYMANRQAARKPLYDAANALSAALTDTTVTDEQMSQLWDNFQSALDTEKTRTDAAEAELDKQIGTSKNPKLAALTLLGVTGDASGYLNSGQGGQVGRGGRGGGMGGGQNGGGQNGGGQNGGGRGGGNRGGGDN